MDRSLDEIIGERPRGGRRGNRGPRRDDYPRDGVRKSTREDSRNIDSEWVHDKFDDNPRGPPRGGYGGRGGRRRSPEPSRDLESNKLRVENIHYELTEDELDDLFNRMGPVLNLKLQYDRSGRSSGVAYVTYESAADAKRAIREYDGANANGQPIRLTAVPNGRSRNPFDSAVAPGRSLADRITAPSGRLRNLSESPVRHSDVSGPPPEGVDRYVPSGRRRSRSPLPRRGDGRRDGRRPGARRDERGGERGGERRGRGGRGGRSENLARDGRPRKTQEELDAEMEDYWGAKEEGGEGGETSTTAAATAHDDHAPVADGGDIDMIE